MSELNELTATQMEALLSSRKASVMEIAKACLQKIKQEEPCLHAWEFFDENLFLNQAQELESQFAANISLGRLHGVPVGIKDVFNTTDMPTSMGSRIWKGFTPGNDARVVESLRWEKALIAGKTVTAEFAVHHPGPTVNPWDASRIPGTSSTGSAVAVAASMIPIAIGTQTAGSIMRPASYCGVYGFKPSFGVIPRTGVLKTLDTLDHVGFLSRSLEDLKLLLDITRVRGKNHPFVYRYMDLAPRVPKQEWRVAFVKTPVWDFTKEYNQHLMNELATLLSSVERVHVEEVELPEEFSSVHSLHNRIYEKGLSYYFKDEYEKKPEWISDVFKAMVERGRQITPESYREGLQQQVERTLQLDRFFESYDIILSHTTSGEAPFLEYPEEPPDPCLMWTFCHVPSIHVPVFRGPSGLPLGPQFVGRRYHDYLLLEFLEQLEKKGIFSKARSLSCLKSENVPIGSLRSLSMN